MAVYTDVAADELAEFLSLYDLGGLLHQIWLAWLKSTP